MSTHHHRAPIGHTCPQIDKYIKSIKAEIVSHRDMERMDEEDIRDKARRMSDELECCIDYLETLRDSNDELRKWAVSESESVDELENRILELEDKNE